MSDNMTVPDGYRLMRDDERPDWMLDDAWWDGSELITTDGRGMKSLAEMRAEGIRAPYFRKLGVKVVLTDEMAQQADREQIANLTAENERLKAEVESLRETWLDRMAGLAMQGLLTDQRQRSEVMIANESYKFAAAMLDVKQRRKA